MVNFEEITYKTFGRSIRMYNDSVELIATLDFGPRIIRFSKIGGENFMFEDTEFLFPKLDDAKPFTDAFGEENGLFRIYGGHRLWTSPEDIPMTYYPDNLPVEYKKDGNCLILTSAVQRTTGLQVEFCITMEEDAPKVTVCHKITNLGSKTQKFAPWAISALAIGGTEVLPIYKAPDNPLDIWKIIVWPFANLSDKRISFGENYIFFTPDRNAVSNFKIGMENRDGWAAYFYGKDVLLKKFDFNRNATYSDMGANFETYACPDFMEMETLGEYKELKSGESTSHSERWEIIFDTPLYGKDENTVYEILKDYIN